MNNPQPPLLEKPESDLGSHEGDQSDSNPPASLEDTISLPTSHPDEQHPMADGSDKDIWYGYAPYGPHWIEPKNPPGEGTENGQVPDV